MEIKQIVQKYETVGVFCSRVEHDLYLPVASLVLPFWTPVGMIKDISYLVMFAGSFPSHLYLKPALSPLLIL